jgi:hypothetical protein
MEVVLAAAASRDLFALERGERLCTFYTVSRDWTEAQSEHMNICAVNSSEPCAPDGI